jgi:hypothetical protein
MLVVSHSTWAFSYGGNSENRVVLLIRPELLMIVRSLNLLHLVLGIRIGCVLHRQLSSWIGKTKAVGGRGLLVVFSHR